MRLVLIVTICLHSIIHLLGFVKAFDLLAVKALTFPISKPMGIAWWISFLLFALVAVTYAFRISYWWVIAIPAIVFSQILIIYFWQDAKFGTIANLIILLATINGFGNWNFENRYKKEVKEGVNRTNPIDKNLLKKADIIHLPFKSKQDLTSILENHLEALLNPSF